MERHESAAERVWGVHLLLVVIVWILGFEPLSLRGAFQLVVRWLPTSRTYRFTRALESQYQINPCFLGGCL